MPVNDKSRFAYNHLISRGLTPVQAAGIVGNLQAESNFDTTVVGKADNKGSIGIAQWHSERKQGLLDFAKKRGERYDNLTTQLDYVVEELNSPAYAKAMQGLTNAKNPQEAAIAFMNHYEKPAEWAKKQSVGQRVGVANSILSSAPYENVDYISEQAPILDISYLTQNYNALSPQQRAEFDAFMNTRGSSEDAESPEDAEAVQAKNELAQKENEKNFLDELNSQYQEAQQQEVAPQQQQAPVDNSVYSMPQIQLPQYQAPQMPEFQMGGNIDMYGNPILARRVDNPNVNRSYYDPRLNTMNIGSDYNTWKDDYTGEPLTGEDLKYHQDKMLAHENYHAVQHSEDRDNYDIAHGTENEQWARMQKRPQMMTTDAVWNNFYNRSDLENQQDYQDTINSYPEARILNRNLLFDKVLDRQRYDNPANLEGEAKFYEDTGVGFDTPQYQSGGFWNTYVDPVISTVTDFITGEDNSQEERIAKKKAIVDSKLSSYEDMEKKYDYINKRKSDTLNHNDYIKNNKERLLLTKGRYRNASINPTIVDEAFKTAKEKNIDPFEVLAIIGRESVFGKGYSSREGKQVGKFVETSKKAMASAWNTSEDYRPESPLKFLADKAVPGVKAFSNNQGWYYSIKDEAAMKKHLAENPRLLEQYNQKLQDTKSIKGADSFDMAVDFIKKKGLKNYNPNDPNYKKMVMQDYYELKSDPVLMNYINKKYDLKDYSKAIYEDGGETDPPVTARDSVAHQVDKILQYEQLRGGPGGTPLPYYSHPKYKQQLMDTIYPQVKNIMPNANAMESAEAMDFIFNAGRDPRIYMLDQYLKSKGQAGIPNRASFNIDMNKDPENWAKKKPELDAIWNQYSPEINKLPANTRRQFLNKGRDWYYQNIDNPAPGVPSSDYNATWYGRIWNTNDYKPFNPNNPKFTKKEDGGYYQDGGLKFLQPTSEKLPQGYKIPYSTPSSERAISIGGENGEPAYLIPSFKYGQPLDDPLGEFRKTGEHLGGPFKTWQEADKWENETRHPAVEKGQNIMFPQQEFKDGGSIPERYRNMGFTRVGAKRQSTRPGKKWMVLAKKGSDYKVVHGGYDGMKDFSQHGSKDRKKRFWDRMGGRDSAKANDPFSPLYWHKRFGTWEEGGYFTDKDKKTFSELKDTYPSDTLVDILTYMSNGGVYGLPTYQDAGVAQGNPVKIVTLQDADGTMRKVRTDSQEYADLYKSGNLQSGDISENADRETWFDGELDQVNVVGKKKTVLTPAGVVTGLGNPISLRNNIVTRDNISNMQLKLKNEADDRLIEKSTIPTFIQDKVTPSSEEKIIKVPYKEKKEEYVVVRDAISKFEPKIEKQLKDKKTMASIDSQVTKTMKELKEIDPDIHKAVGMNRVMTLQKKLYDLGYDLGDYGKNKDGIDGKLGKMTKKALEEFEITGGSPQSNLSLEQQERIARLRKPEQKGFLTKTTDYLNDKQQQFINSAKGVVSEYLPYNLQYNPKLDTVGSNDETQGAFKYLLDNKSVADIRKEKNISFLQISENRGEGNKVLPLQLKDRIANSTNPQGYKPDYEIDPEGDIQFQFFDRLSSEESKDKQVVRLPGVKGNRREDIYRMYSGLPQKYDTFTASSFKAGKNSDTNVTFKNPEDVADYIKIAATHTNLFKRLANGEITPETIARDKTSGKKGGEKINKASFRDPKNVMWNATFGVDFDERGNPYLSFYDNWDLKGKDDLAVVKSAFGSPIEIYDRIPLTPGLIKQMANLEYKADDSGASDAVPTDDKSLEKLTRQIAESPTMQKEYAKVLEQIKQRYK